MNGYTACVLTSRLMLKRLASHTGFISCLSDSVNHMAWKTRPQDNKQVNSSLSRGTSTLTPQSTNAVSNTQAESEVTRDHAGEEEQGTAEGNGSQDGTKSNPAGTNRGEENQDNANEDPKPGSTKKDGEKMQAPIKPVTESLCRHCLIPRQSPNSISTALVMVSVLPLLLSSHHCQNCS